MKLLESDNDFGDVKTDLRLREELCFVQVREEFAALDEIEHKIELFGRLEGIVQRRQKRAIDDLLEDLALRSRVLRGLVLLGHLFLFKDFHCIECAFVDAVDLLDQVHATICAGSKQLKELEVLN